ncbi:MAG TPA: 2'-5' RNA ligase family protein [Candidatus Nanopelagicales bacterium]|nr:2'-5' RNA ligase family protein [Candidatus Nanopelagicales bacterium]
MTSLIGVAVAVPDPWAAELERWRAELGDPQAGAIPAHVTLLPPTPVESAALDEVEQHLAAAAASVEPFAVRLRGTATFRPVSPVVFVALTAGISGCESLEAAVRSGPLHRALDHPYHPHVTVAHDLPDDLLDRAERELASYAADFVVGEILLYTHESGVWHPRRAFPLR